MKVYLPLECIRVHSWKVKSGASVREGETIALGSLPTKSISTNKQGTSQTLPSTNSKFYNKSTSKSEKEIPLILPTSKLEKNEKITKLSIGKLVSSSNTLLQNAKTEGSSSNNITKTKTMKKNAPNESNKVSKVKSARSRMLARAQAIKTNDFVASPSTVPLNTMKINSPADGFLKIIIQSHSEKFVRAGKEEIILATVEPCTHPTIIGSLCAVCGLSIADTDNQNLSRSSSYLNSNARKITDINHSSKQPSKKRQRAKTEKITVSGGITVKVTKSEANSISKADQNRLRSLHKLSLVLDLDHTLVHATADKRGGLECSTRNDVRSILLPIEVTLNPQHHHIIQHHPKHQQKVKTIDMRHFIKLRPNLMEFFVGLQDLYEISIYTAGTRGYAEEVAKSIARHVSGQQLEEEDLSRMQEELERAEADLLNSQNNFGNPNKATHSKIIFDVNEPSTAINKKQKKANEQSTKIPDSFSDTITSILRKSPLKNTKKSISVKAGEKDIILPVKNAVDETNDTLLTSNKNKVDSPSTQLLVSTEKNTNATKEKDESEGGKIGAHENISTSTNFDTIPKKKKRVLFTNEHSTQGSNRNLDKDPQFLDYIHGLRKAVKEAKKMEAKAMELRNKLFGDRIISRTDVSDLGKDVKSLKRVFPCGGAMAAIVDDREDVWAKGALSQSSEKSSNERQGEPPENLLLVKPYKWHRFSGYQDVNNAAGVDLTARHLPAKLEKDNDNEDTQLLWTLDILKRLHARFYSPKISIIKKNTLTVPLALKEMRKQVFGTIGKSMNIVFSGIVPIAEQNRSKNSNGPRPVVERYAEELGAHVHHEVQRDTTHIVAARDGTEKVLRGREMIGCSIVELSWLMECYWSMSKRDESCHLVKAVSRKSIVLEGKKKKILLSGSDESEESDEDDWMEEVESDIINDTK